MRHLLLLAAALGLPACAGGGKASRGAQAPPTATPRVFEQEYVASPSAHFETVAAERRAEEAEAKAAAKAKEEAATAKQRGGKACPAPKKSAGFPPAKEAPAGFPAPAPSGAFPPPADPR